MIRDQVLIGDVLSQLRTLPDGIFATCVTSPPYYGLRSYLPDGHPDKAHEIGTEDNPDEYVEKLVNVFREVRRVLRDDGTLWLNIGDSYANDGKWGGYTGGKHAKALHGNTGIGRGKKRTGLKPKDLIGIPWMLAFALRADGWWLRSEVIWEKPNAKPEAVKDRPTRSHEHVFLLTKSQDYFYDHEAIKEPVGSWIEKDKRYQEGAEETERNPDEPSRFAPLGPPIAGLSRKPATHRNKRSVWAINTKPFTGAHFAVFPPELPEVCIKAGSRLGDLVLDPFSGSGTTLSVAKQLRRDYVGIEVNPDYLSLIAERVGPVVARNEQEDLLAFSEEMGRGPV